MLHSFNNPTNPFHLVIPLSTHGHPYPHGESDQSAAREANAAYHTRR